MVIRNGCSIRQECLDHVVVFGERHLRHILLLYMHYYNGTRTHLFLNKDAPVPRAVQVARRHQFSADYTISMFGFNFRQGQLFKAHEKCYGCGAFVAHLFEGK
jgi:hypothetical protein